MLAASDEYMHERAHDVDDVTNRIIRNIQDQKLYSKLEGEAIVVSETLTPADTVIFSRNIILGYATDMGGVTSHAAIISRSLKIPAVVGLRSATKQIRTGDTIAIDGYAGIDHPQPDRGDDGSAPREGVSLPAVRRGACRACRTGGGHPGSPQDRALCKHRIP